MGYPSSLVTVQPPSANSLSLRERAGVRKKSAGELNGYHQTLRPIQGLIRARKRVSACP